MCVCEPCTARIYQLSLRSPLYTHVRRCIHYAHRMATCQLLSCMFLGPDAPRSLITVQLHSFN